MPPPQQFALEVHAEPWGAQHAPGLVSLAPWQSRSPQQPASTTHAPPALRQQRFTVPVSRLTAPHVRPSPQQLPEVEPGVHVSPSATVQPLGRHTPLRHCSPVQQSAFSTHDSAEARHAQRPLTQSINPQQSYGLVHAAPDSTQQTVLAVFERHDSPVQQVLAEVHAV